MLLVLDPHSGVPAYRQLMDQVKFHVASGLLLPGAELPSTRQLSAELNLNPMTISKAYMLLEAEGVVERRRGQPLVVRAQPDLDPDQLRRDQLRQHLLPAVTVARQLGIDAATAAQLFREVFDETSATTDSSEAPPAP